MAGPFVVGRNRALLDASAKQVFEYLSDLSHHPAWNDESGFKTTVLSEGPTKVGSEFRRERTGQMQGPLILRGGMGESTVTLIKTTTIAVHEPNSVLVFETRNIYNGLLHSIERMTFNLSEEVEGTVVTLVSEIEAMVPSAFIGPVYAIRVARGIFQRLFGNRLTARFPGSSVGPHLSRIKEATEGRKIAGAR
jgi:hypothetical protein